MWKWAVWHNVARDDYPCTVLACDPPTFSRKRHAALVITQWTWVEERGGGA